jgi:hypothetical protein
MKLISRRYHTRVITTSQLLCKNCKYFVADNKECGFFVNTDLVTGQKYYDSASNARSLDTKCGKYGKHFEYNNFKVVTVPYYFVKEFWGLLILPTIGVVVFLVNKKS